MKKVLLSKAMQISGSFDSFDYGKFLTVFRPQKIVYFNNYLWLSFKTMTMIIISNSRNPMTSLIFKSWNCNTESDQNRPKLPK